MLDREAPDTELGLGGEPESRPRADPDTPGADPQHRRTVRIPITRGVVAGGRVVDEWIRQAQQTARLLGGSGATAGWADASGRMFKTASDAHGGMVVAVGHAPAERRCRIRQPAPGLDRPRVSLGRERFGKIRRSANGSRPLLAVHTDAPSQFLAGPRVRLEITSRRPVDVTVDLRRRGVAHFRVLDLRAEQGDAPRIQGTTLDAWESEGLRLRLTVPDDQPSGTYHAVILDPVLDSAVGTVTLKIPD